MGLLASLPYIAGFFGILFAGWLSDFLLARGASLNLSRKLPVIMGLLLATTIVLANYVQSDALVVDDVSATIQQVAADASVSPVHANWIINRGNATASDVVSLIREGQASVRARTGIRLQLEVLLLGGWDARVLNDLAGEAEGMARVASAGDTTIGADL